MEWEWGIDDAGPGRLSPTPMINGYYINLASAEARRHHMDGELRRVGLAEHYRRAAAIEIEVPEEEMDLRGSHSLWATWRNLLSINIGASQPVHILEDDVVLSHRLPMFLRDVLAHGDPDTWDLMFTYINFEFDILNFVQLKKLLAQIDTKSRVGLVDAQNYYLASASSVIINPKSIEKLLSFFPTEEFPDTIIDLFFRDLINSGEINALVTLPFLSTLSEHSRDSTLGFTARDPAKNSIYALDAISKYLFADADADRAAIVASIDELVDQLERAKGESEFDHLVSQCARVVLISDVTW